MGRHRSRPEQGNVQLLQPQRPVLEKHTFNVGFSKRFQEFGEPAETSGATGGKTHQRQLV